MFEATVSIDLGASYTKVAYRQACDPGGPGTVREDAKILMVDGTPLIPSIAIQTVRKERPWVFGVEAAKLNPDATMKVHKNWKANLFLPQNNAESANAVIVAEHFFGWLKGKLESASIDLSKCETRVAMPAFKSVEETARVIGICMETNGWRPPILKAIEPHANTVGLFSQGRSAVRRTSDGERHPEFTKMFTPNNVLLQGVRNFTLTGTGSNVVKAMIFDIGAFTTDFACLAYDVTALGESMPAVQPESHAVGVINQLDNPLFAALAEHHSFDWSGVSFEETELVKRDLYRGNPRSLTLNSRAIKLGADGDRALVDDSLTAFEKEVWTKAESFIEKEKPRIIFLTGGGALIPQLAERLKKRIQEKGLGFGNVEGPGKLVPVTDVLRPWRAWDASGEGLHRLATSLGSTSVYLQTAANTLPATIPEKQPYSMELNPNYERCICPGGNKDCCFCGGTGWRLR